MVERVSKLKGYQYRKCDCPLDSMIPLKHRDPGKFKRQLILYSFLVGLVSGGFSILYRWTLSHIEPVRHWLYQDSSWQRIGLLIGMAVAISWILHQLLTWAPFSGGSGIPQIKAELMNELDDRPFPTLVSKYIGGTLNALLGYSVGREGPSIQMGGMAAKLLSRHQKLDAMQTKYLTTAGASAGLSAAFNAPLAGLLFALEEMYGSMSHIVVLPCIIASIVANSLSYSLLGFEPSFSFRITQHLPTKHIPMFILLGIFCGLVGVLFNQGRKFARTTVDRYHIPRLPLIILTSLLVIIMGYVLPGVQGGGHGLIESLTHEHFTLTNLCILLIAKLILTILCFNSGVQGGIFLPVLVLGALSGIIFQQVNFLGLANQGAISNYLILGMVGVLSSVVRAPILSIVLVTEMTGSLSHLLSLTIVAMVALFTADALKCQPVYESLYRELIGRIRQDVYIEKESMVISDFNMTEATAIVDIPLNTIPKEVEFLIIEIQRDQHHFIPTAKDTIQVFDRISILHHPRDTEHIHQLFKT